VARAAFSELAGRRDLREGPADTLHRQFKYWNNVIEADQGKLKQLIRLVQGFKTLKTAYATIKGFGVMRALRQGLVSAFNVTRDIRGEARVVERAFGLGTLALAEAVRFSRSGSSSTSQPGHQQLSSRALDHACNSAPAPGT
jgi:hypothetical protein